MKASSRKPRLFIGSSTESLTVAYAVQESLDYDAECTVWTQGIFRPTRQALDELVRTLGRVDFAVFVFAPDDLLTMRGVQQPSVRDNVIFELGLFMGHLGPEQCFMISPRGAETLHLPSDLLGLSPLTYDADRRQVLRQGIPLWSGEDETGEATAALERVYAFLNAVADTVLSHPETETRARDAFGKAVPTVWAAAFTYFSSPSVIASEAWGEDLPPIASLAGRWKQAP